MTENHGVGGSIPPPGTTARAALVCWAAFALIALAMAQGWTTELDRTGVLLWRGEQGLPGGPQWLAAFWQTITASGAGTPRALVAGLALGAVLLARRWREAALLAVTVLSAPTLNAAMKLLFARPRPALVPYLAPADGLAFPSGHASGSAAIYLAVALALGQLSGRTRPLVLLALIWSALVAFSRVWLGVHWPSDVLAGWVLGIGWTLTIRAMGSRA